MAWWLGLGLLAAGCGGTPATCGEPDVDCTPQYPPNWEAVYGNTVATSCQVSGCHGGGSAAGELALGTGEAAAYAALVEGGWVLPGDAACSPAWVELHEGTMPPGAPLVAAERCAVQQWIEQGAER